MNDNTQASDIDEESKSTTGSQISLLKKPFAKSTTVKPFISEVFVAVKKIYSIVARGFNKIFILITQMEDYKDNNSGHVASSSVDYHG